MKKKMEDFDINYFLIKNLENQTKFNLIELNLNKNDSLDKKIESVINYLNENINSQFNLDNNKEKEKDNKIPENIWDNDPKDVDYENIYQFSYEDYFKNFLDINKDLFAFYSSYKIIFISKINYNEIFKVKQDGISSIKTCKKINLVIKELKEKIDNINNLKHQFLENLNMKVKFN